MPANAGRAMLPLESLLNPVPSQSLSPRLYQSRVEAPSGSAPTILPSSTASPRMDSTVDTRPRPSKPSDIGKSKLQGPINFPPFEKVDDTMLQDMSKFHVKPSLRDIRQSSEHIPYNSAKKDFHEKTGRESIEAFKYEFRAPDQDTSYIVMWDYNIGLVRMTPFFKSLGYAKTKPSQMLDKNPGLRAITPSVTGGSVVAQGYWMPYTCARAVCATFCYKIAAALIPIFGPTFPAECIAPHSPSYGGMVISRDLINVATLEAHHYRQTQQHSNYSFPGRGPLLPHHNYSSVPVPYPRTWQTHMRHSSSWSPINASDRQRPFRGSTMLPGRRLSSREAIQQRQPENHYLGKTHMAYDPFQHADPFHSAIPQRGMPDMLKVKRQRQDYEVDGRSIDTDVASETMPFSQGAVGKQTRESIHPGTKADPNVEDYAAAEVLVCLQNKSQESTVTTKAGPRKTSSYIEAEMDMRVKKRPKAKSF